MALLNKLFFPSSSTTPLTSETPLPTTGATVVHQESNSSQAVTSSLESKVFDKIRARPFVTIGSNLTDRIRQNSQAVHSKNYLSQFPFDGQQVRVLLYRECDKSGRKLLFDSNALQKVFLKEKNTNKVKAVDNRCRPLSDYTTNNRNRNENTNNYSSNKSQSYKTHSNNCFIEVCEEYGYKHVQPNSAEFTSIGEMVFGASAMSFRGTAFKVHWLQQPPRIICSQVFLTPILSAQAGQSPYSTISSNTLLTPRTSISSDRGSIDSISINSLTMLGYPMGTNADYRQLSLTASDRSSLMNTTPPDVSDQNSITGAPRLSSNYSYATDSGYDDVRSSQMSSSDRCSASYPYSSARSSLGSVTSETMDALQRYSIESGYFTQTSSYDDALGDGGLQRRISRNLRTSFENEYAMNDLIGFIGDSYTVQTTTTTTTTTATTNCGGSEGGHMGVPNYRRTSYSANETRSNPEIGRRKDRHGVGNSIKTMQRRAKLGLAVCITMSESFEEEMELFCSEHIALLESMLGRLRASTERAYINHKEFYQTMFQAWLDTKQWFSDLFTAPRIKCPIWLSITTSGNKYSKSVAEKFIKELCWLISFADTKDTNFFISTLLTAILTHHLGWVSTVAAFNLTNSSATESSTAALEQRAKLLQVSQKHPYNALWAQLGDLYGAIGLPPRLARTVVCGTEKLAVERLLNILTYFIRCGEVRRSAKREDFNKDTINSLVQQQTEEVTKKHRNVSRYQRNCGIERHKNATTAVSGGGSGGGGLGCGDGGYGGSVTNELSHRVGGGGLKRIPTCKLNLNTISDILEDPTPVDGNEGDDVTLRFEDTIKKEEEVIDGAKYVYTLKKNEIPTVLAFRDSRFVKQELRIGNYLMDTGIEKKSLMQYEELHKSKANNAYSTHNNKDGRIRVFITTPENVEVTAVEDENAASNPSSDVVEGVMEAIEIDNGIDGGGGLNAKSGVVDLAKRHFFWQAVKEGLSLSQLRHPVEEKLNERINLGKRDYHEFELQQQQHQQQRQLKLNATMSNISLSDLITLNSMGKSGRMQWGIEPRRENISLEEEIHFDNCQKYREHGNGNAKDKGLDGARELGLEGANELGAAGKKEGRDDGGGGGVVFMLGENEPLVNLKKSTDLNNATTITTTTETAVEEDITKAIYSSSDMLVSNNSGSTFKLCALHRSDFNRHAQATKAPLKQCTDVKFNTEQYQQNAMNYSMEGKNLVLTNYDYEKQPSFENAKSAAQFEMQPSSENLSTLSPTAVTLPIKSTQDAELECVVCQGIFNSSAIKVTELEAREIDAAVSCKPHSAQQATTNEMIDNTKAATATTATERPANIYNANAHKVLAARRGSFLSVAAKCAAVNEMVNLLKLPVPAIKELPQEDETKNAGGDGMKLRAGFVPSLFLSVSDHYISDMVLQGTCSPPDKWQMTLREDLVLAARTASLISLPPAENVAILANMEKWDVRLVSSQLQQHFPYRGVGEQCSTPVGMSQLVASMLETVYAMNNAGIAAYECLAFLESKLQEIYLQSESLATFLLETEFCPLSAVTTALNLSENDVPLLLSIATIHTPQIAKKCGISFR